ncbi:MAG: DEAD/DEAH box helicase family protein [Deltaproteobacteria bacterium]|nr:DEAD/DEAH box helicase family protein [Deltaproteobacteria bacterium]
MALHPKFPKSPYAILDPDMRWFPAAEELRQKDYGKLLPPLVAKLRIEVKKWRDSGYAGASDTSLALLNWWFKTDHYLPQNDGTTFHFQYYFAQREAVETIIYLHEIVKVKDKYDLMRFDSSGILTTGMFAESWRRFVVKMATGSGKTKAMSLVLAWCFFHKLYEEGSTLARNFLIIAPNIIVLERLRKDFNVLNIFFQDPVLPDNGHEGKNWRDDFQLTLHIQDNLGTIRKTGNIFLTNIHRVYESSQTIPSAKDENTMAYFLGTKPTGATTDSKVDLEQIVRDIDELIVLNDEAHHIHDETLAWFKSIEDIHNRLKMKGGELALQVDVTATPRHNDGAIFVQTICDYPLVEAIHQDVVKHPVVPDEASRSKLQEEQSSKFSEKYRQYIHLGVIEWRKTYVEHAKMGKKAVLFIMTDDTKNCDEVAEYLSNTYPEFQQKDSVLVIHTKNNGEISESSTGKNKDELGKLRKLSNDIDKADNPYKAIVSVLMLKEGWDVRNVTTIVGLRAYSSQSKILPEQTLGRGLRRMYFGQNVTEYVSVVGTEAFMEFVDSIRAEGVELERRRMGEGSEPKTPIVIEIDNENTKKDIAALDIEIPVLSPRIYREYKKLSDLNINKFGHKKIGLKQFSEEEQKEIVFKDISNGEITHRTIFDANFVPDYQSVVGYFTKTIMKELRLFSGFDVLFEKVRDFIITHLFENEVNLNDLNTLRNLSELEATKTIIETFKKEINALTVLDKGEAEIRDTIKISKCRPFVAKDQGFLIPKKSPFNKIIGDSHFELEFASFLEGCEDIVSYCKNFEKINFRLDYQKHDKSISNYLPDFIIKRTTKELWIIETKGREDLDDIEKIKRLAQWCDDLNKVQSKIKMGWLYVKQEDFEKYTPKNFLELVNSFKK